MYVAGCLPARFRGARTSTARNPDAGWLPRAGPRGGTVSDIAPLILTLALDAAAQDRFDALRRAHFPSERNVLAAHVTAFHALPGERLDEVVADLRARAPSRPVPVAVTGVRSLGRGVAFDLRAPEVEAVRADHALRWHSWLGRQDRQRWRPHVTVQNKVAPGEARSLHEQLAAAFAPSEVQGVGWGLFRYRGGPWDPVLRVPFGP